MKDSDKIKGFLKAAGALAIMVFMFWAFMGGLGDMPYVCK